MKNMIFSLVMSVFAVTGLWSCPQAVVFTWDNVIAAGDPTLIETFIRQSLHLSQTEFDLADIDRQAAVAAGQTDVEFWLELAAQRGTYLPRRWAEMYVATARKSVGVDPKVYELIGELTACGIRVGLLSNTCDADATLIRDLGYYEPFDVCLLSCEIGVEIPDHAAYAAVLSALDLPPQEVLFIDDLTESVTAANEIASQAILFYSVDQLRSLLKAYGCLR